MLKLTRRNLLKGSAAAVLAAAAAPGLALAAEEPALGIDTEPQKTPVAGSKKVGPGAAGSAARVYFSPVIDAASLIRLYSLVNEGIIGKVAIKVHTGEKNGPNIIPRDMVKALQETIPNSAIVETNTLYGGDRDTTAKHRDTLRVNGWTFCPVDIMDEHGDANLPVQGGFHLKEVPWAKGFWIMIPCLC